MSLVSTELNEWAFIEWALDQTGVVLANAKASPERGLDEESGEAGDDLLGCTWATEARVVSSPPLNGHRKRVLRAGFRAHSQSSCTALSLV